MSYRKNLIMIDYHYDDDSGLYELGEIDCGVNCREMDEYLNLYGEEGKERLAKHIEGLASRVRSGIYL